MNKNNKWLNANFLINAKKCIDSMLYISKFSSKLSHINIREKTDQLRRLFYLDLVNLLDEELNKYNKETKSNIKKTDGVINKIYYERDKKAAHTDKNYIPSNRYESLTTEISDKMKALEYVKKFCSNILPDNLTLDYVPHDRDLFRIVNRVNIDYEEKLDKIKHPFSSLNPKDEFCGINLKPVSSELTILQSIDDISFLSPKEKENYGVLFESGINIYEGLQNRQDSCIKINVLHGCDMWCSINKENLDATEEMRKIGIIDEFDIPHLEKLKDKNILEKLKKIKISDE